MWEYGALEQFEEMKVWQEVLDNYFRSEEMQRTHFSMYCFCAINKASILGNRGRFNESNELAKQLIETMNNKVIDAELPTILYNLPWNFKQQIENSHGNLSEEERKTYLRYVQKIGVLAELFEDRWILELSKMDIKKYKKS